MCYTKNRKENTPYITSMKRKTMKGLKIMTKLLKTITTIAALATTLITVSIYASAQSPVDNGSNARAEMVQNGLIAGQTAESNAFPGWLVLSTAGAAVLVGGIIAGSVISNRNSKDNKR